MISSELNPSSSRSPRGPQAVCASHDVAASVFPDAAPGLPPDLALQQRIAEINFRQAEINAANLRDFERQTQLLRAQRAEIEERLQALDRQTREFSQQLAQAKETEAQSEAARLSLAEAERRLQAVAERERSLDQQVRTTLEKEIFPECLLAPQFSSWRAGLLPAGPAAAQPANAALVCASLHLVRAAFQAADPEELCRVLAILGRALYRFAPAQAIEEIARALNAASANRFSLRLARLGEPTDKTWMSFSGIASVNTVHGWAVFGPDRLKRQAAEVS